MRKNYHSIIPIKNVESKRLDKKNFLNKLNENCLAFT